MFCLNYWKIGAVQIFNTPLHDQCAQQPDSNMLKINSTSLQASRPTTIQPYVQLLFSLVTSPLLSAKTFNRRVLFTNLSAYAFTLNQLLQITFLGLDLEKVSIFFFNFTSALLFFPLYQPFVSSLLSLRSHNQIRKAIMPKIC